MSGRVGIAGTGAVATTLGRCLAAAGQPVVALAGRDQDRAAAAAAFIGPDVRVVTLASLPRRADHVIIAVSDDALTDVARTLAPAMTGVALHTSGASGLAPFAPLRAAGVACGVLHPLQTVVSAAPGENPFAGVSFGVVGDGPAVEWAASLVSRLEGQLLSLEESGLPTYHAGAVMASNALIAVVDASLTLMSRAGLAPETARRAIGPLCRASVEHALERGPVAALTGPVVRGDAATVASHLRAVTHAPETVSSLYRASARHLLSLASARGLAPSAQTRLAELIEGAEAPGEGSHVQEAYEND